MAEEATPTNEQRYTPNEQAIITQMRLDLSDPEDMKTFKLVRESQGLGVVDTTRNMALSAEKVQEKPTDTTQYTPKPPPKDTSNFRR